jgi:UMF1 family MFS transporter
MKMKLTKLEKSWVMYDISNSAFTLLVSTLIPIYFNYLAQKQSISSVDCLAYWGYAASIATLIVAIIGPILGTISDSKGYKRPIFMAAILIGTVCCGFLGLISEWMPFLVVFIIARIGYSSSLIFYDSMLPDVTTEERMDYVSSQGFAWGYVGSCVPFIACLALVLGADYIGLGFELAMIIAFFIIAVWWYVLSLPLLRRYKQKNYVERKGSAILSSFSRLHSTMRNIRKEKSIFLFLLAFFFYIDGVYTIIEMATSYGKAMGLDSNGLLLALLLTQFVAFPCTILFGRLVRRIASDKLIMVCILSYLGIVIFAMLMRTQLHFWILAVLVGMFQGGIQSLSRSYFAKIIPSDKSGEYFGILDICGKGASFLGTMVVGAVSQATGNISIGVGAIAIFFVIGFILFRKAMAVQKTSEDNQNIARSENDNGNELSISEVIIPVGEGI